MKNAGVSCGSPLPFASVPADSNRVTVTLGVVSVSPDSEGGAAGGIPPGPLVVALPPITVLIALLAVAMGMPLCGSPMLVGGPTV